MHGLDETLQLNAVEAFPFDPRHFRMPRSPVELLTYEDGWRHIERRGLAAHARKVGAFAIYDAGRYLIFHRSDLGGRELREALTEEAGHIAAGHVKDTGTPHYTLEDDEEANDIARRLMAPADKLLDMGVTTAEEIHKLTLVPMEQAVKVAREIEALEKQRAKESDDRDKRFMLGIVTMALILLIAAGTIGGLLKGSLPPKYVPSDPDATYYWTTLWVFDFHTTPDCSQLLDKEHIHSGTYEEANTWFRVPCTKCREDRADILSGPK